MTSRLSIQASQYKDWPTGSQNPIDNLLWILRVPQGLKDKELDISSFVEIRGLCRRMNWTHEMKDYYDSISDAVVEIAEAAQCVVWSTAPKGIIEVRWIGR